MHERSAVQRVDNVATVECGFPQNLSVPRGRVDASSQSRGINYSAAADMRRKSSCAVECRVDRANRVSSVNGAKPKPAAMVTIVR